MELGKRQPRWDLYEAVILLDGYLEVRQKTQPRAQIIRSVSEQLRKMARNRGIVIDEVFRNENGISYQLQSMESAYVGHTVYVPATKLFEETVDLYRNTPASYQATLTKAKNLIASKVSRKEAFMIWAKDNLPTSRVKWIEENLGKVERFGLSSKVISENLYDTTDIPTLERLLQKIEKNKIFQIIYRKIYGSIYEDLLTYIQFCKKTGQGALCSSVDARTSETDRNAIPSADNVMSKMNTDKYLAVDFYQLKDLSFTKPKELTYNGRVYQIANWGDLYVQLVTLLHQDHLEIFAEAADKATFRSTGLMIATILLKDHFRIPRPIGNGLYVEAARSATQLVKNIQRFLDLCKVDYSTVNITYIKRDGATTPESITDSGNVEAAPNEGIISVLKSHYQYGFKIDSIREMLRFRQFAEEMGVTVPEKDEELKTLIISAGTIIEDKVYCKSSDLPQELQAVINEVFLTGAQVIYYESLFSLRSSWMDSHVITSEEMLKEYLQRYIRGCSFAKKFMLRGQKRTEKEAVTSEIIRVWGANQTERVDTIDARLPFVPLSNIWRVISGNDRFVLSLEGEYLLIDRFVISQDEIEDIEDYVNAVCEKKGFCPLTDVPLGDIEENNYTLSMLAIYSAIYKVALAGKYHLNGKILTKDKPELDAVLLLKQHIKGKTECTFDEVAEKVVELTGGTNRQYAFQALYDEMVRVDKNRFVVNNAVSFDVSEIDRVLSTFISDHFVAIRDITTFAMFPLCGQDWNHYLLESFCYKYSRKYSLHVIHFNDKNAGIIAEKDFNKSYPEMLAIELARSDVELKTESVGTYLFNTGYMAKSKYAKLGDIVQRAKEIRKEG